MKALLQYSNAIREPNGLPRAILWRSAMLALILSYLVIGVQVSLRPRITPYADSVSYLNVATVLHDTGYYTDGYFDRYAAVTGPHKEGLFFAPLYPAFLAAVMVVDHRFYETARCVVANQSDITDKCSLHLGTVVGIQTALEAISAFLVWLSAFTLTGRRTIAWLSLGLILLTCDTYAFYARQLMTENLALPLFTLGCLLATIGLRRERWGYCVAAGIAWGLLSLTRPSFPYMVYALAGVAVGWAFWQLARRRVVRRFPVLAMIVVAGYAVTVAPWEMRNFVTLDRYAISEGYAPYILYQRVMFNEMTAKEWATSFIFSPPNINKSLLRVLHVPTRDYMRHSYDDPDGFYQQGQTKLPRYRRFVAAAGGLDRQMPYLLKNYILAHPWKHLIVTVAMAWRGMWVSKLWSIATIPAFAFVLAYAVRTAWWDFVVFSLPPWFMLGFNAFTSVNVARYNLTLLPCLAIAGAWCLWRVACLPAQWRQGQIRKPLLVEAVAADAVQDDADGEAEHRAQHDGRA